MKIYSEISLEDFHAPGLAAADTLERVKEAGKCEELEYILEDLFPDGMDKTALNDLLWLEPEQVYEWLGMEEED